MTLAKAGYGIVINGNYTYYIHYSASKEKKVKRFEADKMLNLKQKWINFCESNGLNCTCVDKVERIVE